VTDDVSPDILARSGHLDYVIRKAMRQGMPLGKAITASSMAPARRMGLRDRGAVSPGHIADLVLLEDDSPDFQMTRIFRKGLEIDPDSPIRVSQTDRRFADNFRRSINVREEDIRPEMFHLKTSGTADEVILLSMEKNRDNTYTAERSIRLPVENRSVIWERRKGNLVVVVDRYSGKAEYSRGFMSGCWFRNGSVATSHAHDHHNLLVAGDNAGDMELALKWVVRNQGGIVVVSDGRIISALELPVGGILSEEPMDLLAEKVESLTESMKALGFEHSNPFMSFTTLTLPVSPEVKITDKGIFRTSDGERLNLFL
jgi:adenine deaminase